MKEKLGKRIFCSFSIFFIYIFIIELIVRYSVGSLFFEWATFRIALGTVILSALISLIVTAWNNKLWRNISATVLASFILLYAWFQTNLYHYLGFFMGLGNAEQGTKVTDYLSQFVSAAKFASYLAIIPFILVVLYYWWISNIIATKKQNKNSKLDLHTETKKNKLYTYLIILLVTILLSTGYYITLSVKFMQPKLQSIKNTALFIYPENANLSVRQFGVFTFFVTDLTSNVFNITANIDYNPDDSIDTPGEVDENYIREIDDTAWQKIINAEKNNEINKINNYLINRPITPKNEYTGIFEGKNLIVILMESLNEIAILEQNKEYYPTLYKLYSEGISFRNNYSSKNSCSTGNNEFASMISLYPINYTCTTNKYDKNSYFNSVFNVFKGAGYTATSYHNFSDSYYERRSFHKGMGSTYRNAIDLGINWSVENYAEWPSDVELIEKAYPHITKSNQFIAYLTTVSTHQPYNMYSSLGQKYQSLFKDLSYHQTLKRYMSKMKELDLALEKLLKKLEADGLLENTVIAAFSDHYPYGISHDILSKALPYDTSQHHNADRTPMFIWNSEVESKTINKYTSLMDLLPTLFNMFNLNYDPRYYMGHDIMSNSHDITIFADGAWRDSVGYYSAVSSKFTPMNDANKTYTDEELIKINNRIKDDQTISSLIIRKNYFNYLDNAFKKN